MGPRVFTRGNIGAQSLAALYPKMLQWGHASSRVETSERRASPHFTRRCFNGATRLHAWKHRSAEPRRTIPEDASMGPRVFTRGNSNAAQQPFFTDKLQWGHASSRVETSPRRLTQMSSAW